MSSPAAHAILSAVWRTGCTESVWIVFRDWLEQGVSLDCMNALDLLMMDASWSKVALEGVALRMMEASHPEGVLKDVVGKWACQEHRHDFWNAERAFSNRRGEPGQQIQDPIMWMRRGSEKQSWVQHGGEIHWRKMALLVEHVDRACAWNDLSRPDAILEIIDAFAQGRGQWLKVAGEAKAEVLEMGMQLGTWSNHALAVECGTFIGYTAMRLACSQSLASVITMEVDPLQACIARHFIDIAGLTLRVEVWVGQARDLIPRLAEDFGSYTIGMVFMDHRGTIFHEDLAQIEHWCLFLPSATLVADNVVAPGAPLLLWHVMLSDAWNASAWSLHEFLEDGIEDWMLVGSKVDTRPGNIAPVPVLLRALAWESDHMRRRLEGLRPAEGAILKDDRASFAQRAVQCYKAVGIEALPWTARSASSAGLNA
eukprot:gnl/MRDRNA2_/MRDRNA2_85240_c0_seq1.p1 gnl/MRDRNA2_/MRDRNA2_85240_c0~~gnl/MRDRNA2_/MRDRNA2_85240_c0_seq1.p1  ORF type:complete len:426 (+),score=68.05 gnl/MRDRNA2_/MRDRNA2_85240_c0_seq1:218-1495(+)